jgi:hypothetical protein
MNSEFENQLEAEIDRHLKDLPDLAAPPNLIPRVMTAIARPATPWRVRPWYAWPISAQIASVTLALGLLLAAIPGWRVVEPALTGPMASRFAPWRAGVACLWNAARAVVGAAPVVVEHLNKVTLLSCVAVMVMGYVVCVGFGTVFVRLTLAAPRKKLI